MARIKTYAFGTQIYIEYSFTNDRWNEKFALEKRHWEKGKYLSLGDGFKMA